MRLSVEEKKALKFSLQDFNGKVFLFGSRLYDNKLGGDIDLLLIPHSKVNKIKLAINIEARFFSQLEQKLDVIIYDENEAFSQEVISHAEEFDFKAI